MRKQVFALLLAAVLLTACGAGAEKEPEIAAATELTVHFFDAGKADAILLTTPNHTMLVDAGEQGFGKTILAYLEKQGIERIDYLIVTHFDKDHVGGMARVINNIAVGTVLQSNQPKDSEEYEKYVKALAKAGLEAITVRDTYRFELDGVRCVVDPPRQTAYADDSSNNSSLIVSVTNGANRFLFTGDAQTERLAEFLNADKTAYDVLKVPHHGKEEPLLDAVLASVRPAYAVITSSDEEPESAAVVSALERAGATVLLTRNGAVTLRSDGTTITIA